MRNYRFSAATLSMITVGPWVASGCILLPIDDVRRDSPADAAVSLESNDVTSSSPREPRSSSDATRETSVVSPPRPTSNGPTPLEGGLSDEPPDGGNVDGDDSSVRAPDACASLHADPESGVFVSPTGVESEECGSSEAPCLTVSTAIQRALARSVETVYLAQGSYEETVLLLSPISLIGGFTRTSDGWVQGCDPLAATTVLDSSSDLGLYAEFSGTARLQGLTIRSKGRSEEPTGESRYGIYAVGTDTHLELSDVTILPGDADHGPPGLPGGTLATNECPAGDGSRGANAGTAPPTPEPGFNANGYQPGSGTQGPNGNPGNGGQDGAPVIENCLTGTVTADGGQHGCGGAPGEGGSGAGGGGASIGVFAWFATIHLGPQLTVVTGNGGNGGIGGAGGRGSAGTAGQPGNAAVCPQEGNDQTELRGEPGTQGGPGSDGAKGGDGAGGWVVALLGTSGAFNDANHTDLRLGSAGTAGIAPDGEAKHIVELRVQ